MPLQLTAFDHRKLKEIQDQTNYNLKYYYLIKQLDLSFINFLKHDFEMINEYHLKIATYIKEKYSINPSGIARIHGNSVVYSETIKEMYRE